MLLCTHRVALCSVEVELPNVGIGLFYFLCTKQLDGAEKEENGGL